MKGTEKEMKVACFCWFNAQVKRLHEPPLKCVCLFRFGCFRMQISDMIRNFGQMHIAHFSISSKSI